MEASTGGYVSEGDVDKHKNSILDRVASSNAFFKSQQLGEKDLTFEEKRQIAETLLQNNVPVFLQRYWKFVDVRDLRYFESCREDYEVNFYVSEIMKLQDVKSRRVKVKNRRYEALRSLLNEGSYFSEVEMKKRNPLLYEQLVGQYLSESERAAVFRQEEDCGNSFASFLMKCFDKSRENSLMVKQQEEEDAVVEEEDDDDDDELESEKEEEDVENRRPELSDSEKEMMKNEFKNIMYESFLAGKDSDFDYSTVDDNAEYDSVDLRGIDEEEKYFDEESPDLADDDDDMDYKEVDSLETEKFDCHHKSADP